MKIKQSNVNRKYILISIWVLLIIIVAHYSYPFVKAYRLKKEIVALEKKLGEDSGKINALQRKIDSLQKADDILLNKIMHGDSVQAKK